MSRLFLCISIVALCIASAVAAEESDSLEAREQKETSRLIATELPNWAFWAGEGRARTLVMQPKSVLKWSNPATGRVYGDVYVWTDNGRPEVIMSLFKAWQPANGFHVELHSLSTGELSAERSGETAWQVTKPGIEMTALSDAPVPAASPALRLTQMKALAREFSVELTDRRVNDKGEEQSLRLLSQPLYRYAESNGELRDGGLFTFALGTDPEVFLLLEADQGGWKYGIVRMNDGALVVLRNDKPVWTTGRAGDRDNLHDPYILKRLPETPAQ
jgi:hypothetical protein